MKKIIMLFGSIALMVNLTVSCNQNNSGQSTGNDSAAVQQQTAAVYECPMKCEGKTYSEPGKCSACGMDLVKIENK